MHAKLVGLGSCLPRRRLSNDDLTRFMATTDAWVRRRTGIGHRHWVEPGTATCDLAVRAGALALESAGADTVDTVVVATTTPDRLCPGVAPEVASRLGFTGVAAFDVNGACTGFVAALATAAGLLAAGTARTVLVIGAETWSPFVDHDDPRTAVIFGDGAAAVVLTAAEAGQGSIGPCVLGSDGENADLVGIPAGGSRQRSRAGTPEPGDHYLRMQGRALFPHAVHRMSECARQTVARAGWDLGDVDRVVVHQANARITSAVTHELGIDPGRVVSNIDRVGNTAAASVPLLLADAAAGNELRPGHRVLVVAFGAGLSWGGTTLTWPEVVARQGTFPGPDRSTHSEPNGENRC